MSGFVVGEAVVVAVPSLMGARAVVERVESRRTSRSRYARSCYWIRIDSCFPDRGFAGGLLAYFEEELESDTPMVGGA